MARYPFSESAPSAGAVRRMLRRSHPAGAGASLVIHPEDDMYAFGVGMIGHEPLTAMAYFRAGASMIDVIERIALWRFGSLDRVGSFLDFAAGYGRSTRFLPHYLPAERITVAEIQSDALAFQAEQFGVSTLQSTTDPAALSTPHEYDFIFVASLFTHLPRATFGPWLAKLWEMVAPGGVLVVSIHDEVLDKQAADWEDGFAFVATSEVAVLDLEQYGVNFTTEQFVRAQLSEWIGADADDAIRLPQALCFQQDVWVLTRGPRPEQPLDVESGPNGVVDRLQVNGGDFELSGWAADVGPAITGAASHRIDRVAVSFTTGATVNAVLAQPRPEIADHLGRPGDPVLQASGWIARGHASRPIRVDDVVTVTATCEAGRSFVLDSSLVLDMLKRTGGTLPDSPIRRGLLTARAVYHRNGSAAVIHAGSRAAHSRLRALRARARAARATHDERR